MFAANCEIVASKLVCRFPFTGQEQAFTVPAGVTSIHIHAIGGSGGPAFQCTGYPFTCALNTQGAHGAGIRVSIRTRPGEVLYLDVGSSPGIGAMSGGDSGMTGVVATGGLGGGSGYNGQGGGGGGASIVLICPISETSCQQRFFTASDPRLVVAGGGGAAGFSGGLGGVGGPAGAQVLPCRGVYDDAARSGCGTYVEGGRGGAMPGGQGTATGPGAGGAGSDAYGGITAAGGNSNGIFGGKGFDPSYSRPHVEAGGGGSGYYAGGGGGCDTEYDSCGAGGGSGSSFVHLAGTVGSGTYNIAITHIPAITIKYP